MPLRYTNGYKTGRLSEDDAHCLKCFYHNKCEGYVGCEFILVTGQRRGCEPGLRCKRFVPGDPSARWNLPEDSTLKPGEIPGQAPAASPGPITKGQGDPVLTRNTVDAKHKVELNRKAWNDLRARYGTTKISRTIGYNVQTLYRMQRIGVISLRMAALIQQAYGVDVRA